MFLIFPPQNMARDNKVLQQSGNTLM